MDPGPPESYVFDRPYKVFDMAGGHAIYSGNLIAFDEPGALFPQMARNDKFGLASKRLINVL